MVAVPVDRLRRNPLITEAGYRRLNSLLQHPDAPVWNYDVGDRVEAADLAAVDEVRAAVRAERRRGTARPPAAILGWVRRMRRRVPLFTRHLQDGLDLERDWAAVPTMSRGDFVAALEDIVPPDEDLSRLIVYDTSGVTGHAIRVPHHPRAIAQNHALMEFVLERHAVRPRFSPDVVACLNVGAQVSTVVFATVFSVWNQAGFAKVNLHPRAWQPDRARRFFADVAPLFLTGDPLGFAEMLAWDIDARPAAMVSTAVALLPGLRARLSERYGCPLIDTYATTETGPIAYSSPDGDGMSVLPTDIHVEVVDEAGHPVAEGEYGEICVTGGRNPFVPLLRYRTGDFGRLRWSDSPASDPAPRIVELSARQAVAFRAADDSVVSPVDIGRIIRDWVFVQHTFVQHKDRSCDLVLLPAVGCPLDVDALSRRMAALFGDGVDVRVRVDPDLAANAPGGKVVPWVRE
jgi:phenylacetate-CoA ligase